MCKVPLTRESRLPYWDLIRVWGLLCGLCLAGLSSEQRPLGSACHVWSDVGHVNYARGAVATLTAAQPASRQLDRQLQMCRQNARQLGWEVPRNHIAGITYYRWPGLHHYTVGSYPLKHTKVGNPLKTVFATEVHGDILVLNWLHVTLHF